MTLGFEKQPKQGIETGFLVLTLALGKAGYKLAQGAYLTMVSITVQLIFSYALSFIFLFFLQPLVENGARSQVPYILHLEI